MIRYIIVRLLSFVMWVFFAIVAIPSGIFILLNKWFPVFSHDQGFMFWTVFGIITIVAYFVLWKPILWIIGVFQLLGGAGQ